MRMTGGNLGRSFASLLLRTIAGEPAETLQELHAIEFVDRDSHRRSSALFAGDMDKSHH